jgi:hypothetical protein
MLRPVSDVPVTQDPVAPSLTRRERWVTAGSGVVMVAVVPFVVTSFFRLGLPALVVLLLCLFAGGGLLAVPKRGPWLALGWAVGCVLWAAALVVILWQFGQGMESLD